MPIATTLLTQIKNNDLTLKTLNLCNEELNDDDIQQLVNALATNTILTSLGVGDNQIGAEGAKALAANTTLTSLDVSYNQIGDKGAKALAANTTLTSLDARGNQIGDKGAKALAANTTLTSLDVSYNRIGDEGTAFATNVTLTTLNVSDNQIGNRGAKALAANTTLTTLNIGFNWIGDEGAKALATNTTLTSLDISFNQIETKMKEQLEQAIARNNQLITKKRRAQLIQALILLAYDKTNPNSQSLWSRLPQEVMLYIINFIDFRPFESIGKNAQQIKACATFIFNNVPHLKAALTEAVKTQQNFKIMERRVQGKSRFTLFPLPLQPISTNITHSEKINKHPKKI